jgi:hypothetical protein
MQNNTVNETEKSGKEKVIFYLKIGIVIALGFWLFSIASGARGTANENANIIRVPKFEINYVAGGGQRFLSTFTDVENVDTEDEVKEKNYLWSTVIVKNNGGKEAQDNEIEIFSPIPMKHVLITPPGYSNDVNLTMNNYNKKATVDIESIERGEEVYIFVAMEPANYSKPYDNQDKIRWTKEYDAYLQEINVKSDFAEANLYAPGYSGYYE